MNTPRALRLILASALGTVALRAGDPPPPPGGFGVVEVQDRVVTWSDGYRTRVDVYRPDRAPAPGGWPCVITNHGSGGTRKNPGIQAMSRYLARFGYVVWAFDRRGAGDTIALNAGWTLPRSPERELLDQAESVPLMSTLFPGLVDTARLGLSGISGGGQRAMAGAAWSGRPLPVQSHVTHHPIVSAVAPEIAVLDSSDNAAPDDIMASDFIIDGIDPADPKIAALLARDYPTFSSLVDQPYNQQRVALMRQSSVPLLMMVAAQDIKVNNVRNLEEFAQLSMPKKLFLTTGGHGTVDNEHEDRVMQDLRRRWFDRFVKGIANGADLEAPVEVAVQPTSHRHHANPSTIWEHRSGRAWPPALATTDLYLRDSGRLEAVGPTATEAGPTVQHRVAPGFDVAAYVAAGSGLRQSRWTNRLPKVEAGFRSAPLPEARELIGRPAVEVTVDDTSGSFQLSAELTHVAPDGTENWIALGTYAVRSTAGRHTMRIELDDCTHVIPAGHRIQLKLMNLADHRPPGGGTRVRIVPEFHDTDTTVSIEPGNVNVLELPLRDYRANLAPRLAFDSATDGIDHTMRVSAGPGGAGLTYATFISASGEGPGLSLPGLPHIPLNLDAFTQLGLSLQNTAAFQAFVGTLDADGRALPRIALPPAVAASLAGERLTIVSVIVDGRDIVDVAGPATLEILP